MAALDVGVATPDSAPDDVMMLRRQAAAILGGRDVRRAAKMLRKFVIHGLQAWSPENSRIVESAVQHKAWPSDRAPEQQVPDTVRDVRTHMERATAAVSPSTTDGRRIHTDARAAVRHAAKLGSTAEAWRDRRARAGAIGSARRMLAETRAKLDAVTPAHVRRMRTRIDPALLAAANMAVNAPDIELAADCVVGLAAVGDIPPSGWWPSRIDEPPVDIETLDHSAWHDELEARMAAQARQPDNRARMAAVLDKTLEERAAGTMNGPFTREELRDTFGERWRAMERFGVVQHDKLRPCDNAKTALHNMCTRLAERMVMSAADFPARAAAAFYEELGRPVCMSGGTDDIGSFYRVVPCREPRWTVVAVFTDEGVRYFTLPSFNFGLASAPNQCCRVSEAALRIVRGLGGVVSDKFVDDFVTVEPRHIQASGQWAAGEIMRHLGVPFADKKHVTGSPTLVYLGVRTEFGDAPCLGADMSIDEDRRRKLCAAMQQALDVGELPSARAATFAGKLVFTLTWMAGKVGRAALQPLFAAAERDGCDHGMMPSARRALEFFINIMPWLPPRRLHMAPSTARPILVWTDGAAEVGAEREHTIGFVVAVPRAGAPPAGVTVAAQDFELVYDCFHGSAELDRSYMRRFMLRRKQQIGQVELVGAFSPYNALDASVWAGKQVIHWVDNSSAVAALAKGYSSAIDSALIVQATHATLAGLGADVWFEYVRTDANVADEPSRVDMSYERYAIGADIAAGIRAFVTSTPVAEVPLPAPSEWDADAAAWATRARQRQED